MNYDVVVPITERNLQILGRVISGLKGNISCRNIFLIGNQNLKERCNFFECSFIDEDKLYGTLTYDAVKKLIIGHDYYAGWRTGWYLQQFLKMSYSCICQDEYYLVWDADTILLKPIQMFDSSGQPFFDIRDEYHLPYFTIMKKLFGNKVKKGGSYSYICEYMLIKTEYMRALISDIENEQLLEGKYYFEKIVNSIRGVDLMHSGFSEYETYGNYINTYFPDKYKIRKLKALRNGDKYIHYPPIEEELNWAAESYDIITMENRQKMYSDIIGREGELIKKYSLEEIVKQHTTGL